MHNKSNQIFPFGNLGYKYHSNQYKLPVIVLDITHFRLYKPVGIKKDEIYINIYIYTSEN